MFSIFTQGEVRPSADFERIKALPRRRWEEWCDAHNYVDILTAKYRMPGNTHKLRPVQATSLLEAARVGGLFGPQRVGAGKTITSLICPLVMEAQRPVLLLPANLLHKTRNEMDTLRKEWLIPPALHMISYEALGRKEHKDDLEHFKPDLIIADECHRLKSSKAGVTRRVKKYMLAHPTTRFVALSGTMLRNALEEYIHILHWCLKDKAPVPFDLDARMEWGGCLDPKNSDEGIATAPGVLKELCNAEELEIFKTDPMKAVRIAYRRRINETPGVVATEEGVMDMSLLIDSRVVKMEEKAIKSAIYDLKNHWVLPDGQDCFGSLDVWRHLNELACGFYYHWNPLPPQAWRDARKAWAKFIQKTMSENKDLDTPGQVTDMVRKGILISPEYGQWIHELEKPRADGKPFVVNTEPVFLSDAVIDVCIQWMKEGPGIVWTEHSAFARRLSQKSGVPYYGREGVNSQGVSILEHAKIWQNPRDDIYLDKPLIASRQANGTGKNLQKFYRNLMPIAPTSASDWEQTLGRTHRDGQKADEVSNTLLFTIQDQVEALDKVRAQARRISDTTGQEQKLCYATFAVATKEEVPTGM